MGFRDEIKGIIETMRDVLGKSSGNEDPEINAEVEALNAELNTEGKKVVEKVNPDGMQKGKPVNSRSSIMNSTKGRVNENQGREPGE